MKRVFWSLPTLPFAADHFNAVTCRFGVMFFPDMLFGVKEMVRVLKPGVPARGFGVGPPG